MWILWELSAIFFFLCSTRLQARRTIVCVRFVYMRNISENVKYAHNNFRVERDGVTVLAGGGGGGGQSLTD